MLMDFYIYIIILKIHLDNKILRCFVCLLTIIYEYININSYIVIKWTLLNQN